MKRRSWWTGRERRGWDALSIRKGSEKGWIRREARLLQPLFQEKARYLEILEIYGCRQGSQHRDVRCRCSSPRLLWLIKKTPIPSLPSPRETVLPALGSRGQGRCGENRLCPKAVQGRTRRAQTEAVNCAGVDRGPQNCCFPEDRRLQVALRILVRSSGMQPEVSQGPRPQQPQLSVPLASGHLTFPWLRGV